MQLLYDDNNISINLTKFDFIYLFIQDNRKKKKKTI